MSYCSKQCQVNHWKKGGHKQVCAPVPNNKESSSPRAVSDIGHASNDASAQLGAKGLRPVSVVVSARAQRLKRTLSAFLAMTVLLVVTGQPLPFGLQKLVDRVSPKDYTSNPFPYAPSSIFDSESAVAAGTASGGQGECEAGACDAGVAGKGNKAAEVKTGGSKKNGEFSGSGSSEAATKLTPTEVKAAAKAEKAEKARLAKEQKAEAARVAAEAKQALKAQKAQEAREKKAAQDAKKAADKKAKEQAKAEKAEAARLAKEAAKEAKLAAAAAKQARST